MGSALNKYEEFYASSRNFLRQHWQKLLRVREKLWLSEEAIHLCIAGVVGLMGGIINVLFFLAIEKVQMLAVGHPGMNIVEVAESISPLWRFVTTTLGGFVAGAVLFGGCAWRVNRARPICWKWWWRAMAGCRCAAGWCAPCPH